jgi:aspartyl-tRNA(Asn)/glutamyl-tRNA(Gln) amidotransferase subunit A
MPAAVCGIAGHKPTYGLVSRRGVLPNSYSFDHCGPMAWTAEDCALMLGVMAGHDPEDPASLDAPAQDYAAALTTPVRGLRIGVIRSWYETEVQAEPGVLAAMDAALRVLADLGCVVGEAKLPSLRTFGDAKTPITLSELYALHESDLKTRPDLFGRSLRYRVLAGSLVRAEDYIQSLRWRAELTAEVGQILRQFDLLVTAGAFTSAPSLDPDEAPTFLGAKVPSITGPFNTTGMPTLAVCAGYDAAGLPVGMQIAGRPMDDGRVLALGHAFEQATAGSRRRPDLTWLEHSASAPSRQAAE